MDVEDDGGGLVGASAIEVQRLPLMRAVGDVRLRGRTLWFGRFRGGFGLGISLRRIVGEGGTVEQTDRGEEKANSCHSSELGKTYFFKHSAINSNTAFVDRSSGAPRFWLMRV